MCETTIKVSNGDTFIGGSQTRYFENWKDLEVSPTILDWIENGVSIPNANCIPTFEQNNRKFNLKETYFLRSEIKDLLKSQCIEKCDQRPKCVSPLTVVPKKGGKQFRLVLDLRLVNSYSTPPSFVHEDIDTVRGLCTPKANLVTVDLKSGFHNLSVNKSSRDLLGFKFEGTYYRFTTLVFGLSWSPYIFSKTVRCVVRHLRGKGLRLVAYVDDFCIIDSPENIESARDTVIDTLQRLGFYINFEKSSLQPDTRKQYIGYIIDTSKSDNSVWIEIPPQRIRTVKHDITRALRKGHILARGLARIAGQLVSMSKAIVPTKLLLRNIYRLLSTKKTWSDILVLDIHSINDLEWWHNNLNSWNGKFLQLTDDLECVQLATDASKLAWGGHILNSNLKCQGYWSTHVRHQSSNYREMGAVLNSLLSFTNRLKGKKSRFCPTI